MVQLVGALGSGVSQAGVTCLQLLAVAALICCICCSCCSFPVQLGRKDRRVQSNLHKHIFYKRHIY